MNDAKSYAKPVEIGEVMEAGALSPVSYTHLTLPTILLV